MTWRPYALLAILGLALAMGVAAFQPAPGYMDADYYYAGGLQLAAGRGFSEPYLWNYLDDPAGLPHPSHAYWMPLASLLAAAGASLFGPGSWSAARTGFLALAAAIPPLTAALAWSFTSRRDLSIASGLLAVFSGFYLPFLTTTDTFGLYMVFGALFFLAARRSPSPGRAFFLGALAGLMHLSRADGPLWLLLALAAVILPVREAGRRALLRPFLLILAGYLLVMAPWFVRNLAVFGAPLAPGGSRSLWLTGYDQLFAYPAGRLTFAAWWQSGLAAIAKARLWALGLNLANTLTVQGAVFLLPLILAGAWSLRRDGVVRLAALAWLLTIGALTLVFPFAGARGGFFHSGSALQPVWWALAPVGVDRLVAWGTRRRGWRADHAGPVFRAGIVVLAALLTAVIVWGRVVGGSGGQAWGQERSAYSQIGEFLASQGAGGEDVVIVANPPGFHLASGNPAVVVPDGDVNTVLAVAGRYGAKYLVLEAGSFPAGLTPVYQNPDGWARLSYLGEVEEARVFAIQPCTPRIP